MGYSLRSKLALPITALFFDEELGLESWKQGTINFWSEWRKSPGLKVREH